MGHPVQPSCRSRVTYSWPQRTLSRRVLDIFRDGGSTTSLHICKVEPSPRFWSIRALLLFPTRYPTHGSRHCPTRYPTHCPMHGPRHCPTWYSMCYPSHCPTHGPRHCPLLSLPEFISSLLCKSPAGRWVCRHLSWPAQLFTTSAPPCPPFPTHQTDPSAVGRSNTVGKSRRFCLQPFLSHNESCGSGL